MFCLLFTKISLLPTLPSPHNTCPNPSPSAPSLSGNPALPFSKKAHDSSNSPLNPSIDTKTAFAQTFQKDWSAYSL